MCNLKWTSERPTNPGFYWYRGRLPETLLSNEYLGPVEIYQIDGLDLAAMGVGYDMGCDVADMSGLWAGPIMPPERAE